MAQPRTPADCRSAEGRAGGTTRRRFLYLLGAGGGLSLAGYFVVSRGGDGEPNRDPAQRREARPRLAQEVRLGADEDGLMTLEVGGNVCAVNEVGGTVVRFLDGRHTVPEIAARLAAAHGLQADEPLAATVALFVAQVGLAGLLEARYEVTISETVTG